MSSKTAPPLVEGPPLATLWSGAMGSGPLSPEAPGRPPRARFTLPAHEALVGCLRRAARTVLSRWRLSDGTVDSALLIVGELAANAAVHGRSEMSLHLVLAEGGLGILVGDHGDPAPSPARAVDGDPDEHGRGLDIVHAQAARVELHHDDHGTWILATLAVAASPARVG
ncbi:ATP-binding protein [Streptomyces sp. NPDC006624]|uniref:ATP-binding protein n=1 Tax=Streptomyces sp. NPDC006624 TaxID=3154892 RepID=UPI0033AC3DA3